MSQPTKPRVIDTGTEEILCRVEERVGVVTLNRPEARNALTPDMREVLHWLVPQLGEDEGVGCVLLTGAGGAFCAGGDTKSMAETGSPASPEDRLCLLKREHEVVSAIHHLRVPVIGALPGPAAGAGFGLCLACDLRIAAESAFVTTAFARLGLSGDYGGTWFLTNLVGTAKARELYFTGARVDAREGLRLGLFNRVVPDAELDGEALALARQIAAGPPIAFRYMKDNLNRACEESLESCLNIEAERMVAGAQTEDYREAVQAFVEKRQPVFHGR